MTSSANRYSHSSLVLLLLMAMAMMQIRSIFKQSPTNSSRYLELVFSAYNDLNVNSPNNTNDGHGNGNGHENGNGNGIITTSIHEDRQPTIIYPLCIALMPVPLMISSQHLTATGTDNINCIK